MTYTVIQYYTGQTGRMSKIGAAALNIPPVEAAANLPPERPCEHHHRSLQAAIRCARKEASGWNSTYGDRAARVETEDGTVVFRVVGGMKVTFT